MKAGIVGLACVGLAACGGPHYSGALEEMGLMTVVEGDRPGVDYKFYVRNYETVGDIDQPAVRIGYVRHFLRDECKQVDIVDDAFLSMGLTRDGSRKRGHYIIRVRCIR